MPKWKADEKNGLLAPSTKIQKLIQQTFREKYMDTYPSIVSDLYWVQCNISCVDFPDIHVGMYDVLGVASVHSTEDVRCT